MPRSSISTFVMSVTVFLVGLVTIVGYGLSSLENKIDHSVLSEAIRDEEGRNNLLDIFLGNSAPQANPDSSFGDEIIVPAIREGHHLFVEVELNDYQTAHLLVDTGATDIMLQPDLAADIGLSEGESVEGTYYTPNGPTQQFITTLDTVRVGEAVQHHVRASFGYGMQAGLRDGLLGMSFLKHYHVDIDLARRELHLRPRSE